MTRRGGVKAAQLPSGTVTFLFSDIESSTRRWDQHRAAMQDAVRTHDRLMREAIAANGGFVFKTIGDAFCASFATPQSAAGAAVDAQRALAAADFSDVDGLRVRMAIHTGTADERHGDYFGPAVNRVARLLAIGHGGQVLVSSTTAELLHGALAPWGSLLDLGAHRLKDLARPEHVYQIIATELPPAFPALRSLDGSPNNLPLRLTSFVGREREVSEVKSMLQGRRLVTLVGTGGAGKTRCALQVGAELLDAASGGVWLVELAALSDASLVTVAIAQTLRVHESPNRPLLDTLLAYLNRQRLVLILDNCEHVIGEARTIAAAILRSCPDVQILATSRESLGIAGEGIFRMPSLAVPSISEPAASSEEALRYGAVALFIDRALASDHRFVFTDDDVPLVAEICRRLDGIPLAIELAAARVNVLSLQQLAQKLDERFRVLTGGDRSALPRQQTMRAAIDWSYDLLPDSERAFFRRLAVFVGGFTLESAGAVCGEIALDEILTLELLSSLVDKSLVQVETIGSGMRYRLLESTRQYAGEKLIEANGQAAAKRAHAAAFLALAEQLESAYDTTPDRTWFSQAELELENWRTALEWTLAARADVLTGQRLAGTIRRIMAYRRAADGLRWATAAMNEVDASTPLPTVALLDLAQAHLNASIAQHKASYAAAELALGRYRELNDPLRIAEAQLYAGYALVCLGRIFESEILLEETLAAARRLGARKLTGSALQGLATARQQCDDLAGARERYTEALVICKTSGAERLQAQVALNLAEAEFRAGDAATALRLAGEALDADRAAHSLHVAAHELCNMAAYLVALSRYDEARTHALEGLALAHGARYEIQVVWGLQHLAAVAALRPSIGAAAREDCMRAARLLGYIDSRLIVLETDRGYTEQQECDAMRRALRETFEPDELEKLMNVGAAWSEDQAVAEAQGI